MVLVLHLQQPHVVRPVATSRHVMPPKFIRVSDGERHVRQEMSSDGRARRAREQIQGGEPPWDPPRGGPLVTDLRSVGRRCKWCVTLRHWTDASRSSASSLRRSSRNASARNAARGLVLSEGAASFKGILTFEGVMMYESNMLPETPDRIPLFFPMNFRGEK